MSRTASRFSSSPKRCAAGASSTRRYKVARGGLSRYPGLADAHDLHGADPERSGRPRGRLRRLGYGAAARSDADQRAQGRRLPLLPRRRRGRGARSPAARGGGRPGRRLDPPGNRPPRSRALRRRGAPARGAAATPAPVAEQPPRAVAPADATPPRARSTASTAGSEGSCWSTRNGLRLGGRCADVRRRRRGRPGGGTARRRLPRGRPRDPPAGSRALALDRGRIARRPSRSRRANADTVLLAARDPSLPLARRRPAGRAGRPRGPSWLEAQA